MRIVLLILLAFCFYPYFARGEPIESARADTDMLAVSQVESFPANCSVSAPDITGWETVRTSRIEFRLSDYAAAYLGLDIEYAEYRNPLNSREFIRVISRHTPLISVQNKLNERVILDAATTLYNQKEEQDRFNKLEKEIDSILFMRWGTKENPRTGKDMQDGDIDLWFLKSSGECLVAKNKKLGEQFLTENVGDGKPKNVFVGVKYRIGDVYHILKVNRGDILLLTNGDKK